MRAVWSAMLVILAARSAAACTVRSVGDPRSRARRGYGVASGHPRRSGALRGASVGQGMRAARVRWARCAALLLGAAGLLALCSCSAPARHRDWDDGWAARARRGGRGWRAGTVLEVERYEGRPTGPEKHTEHWQLLRADSTDGEFEVRMDGGAPRLVRLTLHPQVPQVPLEGSGQGIYAVSGALVAVRVPAGRFDCGHTWRAQTMPDGRVMRIEEWWAPNIPTPVRSWTRWEGIADSVTTPPASPADVGTGMSWRVLVAIRQP